jgi:predicted AAA+ superfamily ATPase
MNTVEKYSGYLENAMLVFLVGRYSHSSRVRNKSPRKVYSIDPGLSNAVGFRFSENFGKLAENIVALELRRRMSGKPQSGIYYWRENGGPEVDFVVKSGMQVRELIQVCWDVSKPETRKREVHGILKAMEALRLDRGTILNEEYEGEEKIMSKTITYRKIVKWLLQIE